MRASPPAQLRAFYRILFDTWGRQHWWPARSRFEVIVGAYLTQNTAWSNVERALRKLRRARRLTLAGIRNLPLAELEALIRSAGYFRQKARRLKIFVQFLDDRHAGSLTRLFAQPTALLRRELLELNGVGPETADSILLYAGNHPVFVVDAYTRRILHRHRILPFKADYEEIRALFETALSAPEFLAQSENLLLEQPTTDNQQLVETGNRKRETPVGSCHPPSPMSSCERAPVAQVYNEMHGLLVGVGKNYCLASRALCQGCPLEKFLTARPRLEKKSRARRRLRIK